MAASHPRGGSGRKSLSLHPIFYQWCKIASTVNLVRRDIEFELVRTIGCVLSSIMASSLNALILCTTPLGIKISPSSGVYIFVSGPSVTSILPLMTWWISSWVSCQCGGTLNAMSSAVEFNWEATIWTRMTQSLSFRKVCEWRAQWHVCQCRYQFRWTWTYHRDAICEGYSWGKSISFGCHTEVRWGAGLNLQCNLHYQDEEFIYNYITHGRMSEFHVCGISQSAGCAAHPSLKMGTHQKTPLCTIADAADRAPERLPQLIPSVGMSIRPIMSRLLLQLQCCVSSIQEASIRIP